MFVLIARQCLLRYFLVVFLVVFVIIMIIGFSIFTTDDHEVFINEPILHEEQDHHEAGAADAIKETIKHPIIMWWSKFTGQKYDERVCGDVTCVFTEDRHYKNHPNTKVFMFYGSDFSINDLPLPRKPHHEWGLFHEESPKNNYLFSHADIMTMFNHTCTFKRESDYSITTQHLPTLEWLEDTRYLLSTGIKNSYLNELAPILYVHSDCDTPSDRDTYINLLQKYIKIDSYGTCLHNKDLPRHLVDPIKGMLHKDFLNLVAKYKFAFSMENGICDDYITEKLWRPLMVGTVPVVLGSSKVQDFLPAQKSAVLINEFKTAEDLAKHLLFLNSNDAEYEQYLRWKKTGVTNSFLKKVMKEREWEAPIDGLPSDGGINFIEGFECFVCKRTHENLRRLKEGRPPKVFQASLEHYGCPMPFRFNALGQRVDSSDWAHEWHEKQRVAKALRYYLDRGKNFTLKEIHEFKFISN